MADVVLRRSRAFKRGDSFPPLEAIIRQCHDGAVMDLQEVVHARFLMRSRERRGEPCVSADATVEEPLDGLVVYVWDPQDLVRAGEYDAEFEFTRQDGSKFTAPTEGYLHIRVIDDLDAGSG